MRKVLISVVIVAIMLTFPIAPTENIIEVDSTSQPLLERTYLDDTSLLSVGGSGNILPTIQYMSREISGEQMSILNSYIDTSTHSGVIDLTSFQVSGWTLYQVDVDATAITATAERVSLDVDRQSEIRIENDTDGTHLTTDALYQAFYNLPHDGKLENYSLTYLAPYYQPSSLGYAFLVVRSDYSSGLTNETSWISPFVQDIADRVITHDCSADNAILNASTYYYTVIDGTGMTGINILGTWYFNTIIWRAEDTSTNPTGYHLWDDNTWYLYQGIGQREADLNYTYTPWNKTSSSALTYSSAEAISLTGNASSLTGTSWSFTSANNITQISFASDQSVDIDYDITLWYQKTGTTDTNWDSETPGPTIDWNSTTTATYPVLSGTLTQFLNYTVPTDWNPTALYDGNTLVLGTHTKYDTTVHCTDMTDGTWTLSSNAPNYVSALDLSDSLDSSPIIGKVNNIVDMDIDATIEDGDTNPITGGTTNLTILQSGSQVHTDADTAVGGLTSFLWDINATTTGNGTHSVEVFWTNGTEAGYRVVDVFVYHATTLVVDDTVISAYTDNTFDIGINFNRVFPALGLGIPLADVDYSFDGGVNTSLSDQTGGRWTATVDTTGKTDGTYQLIVYAEGLALENQSITITVNLVYQTQALVETWSNGNDIAYLEYTNLSVIYRRSDGTNITSATVNVTFQGSTYDMTWNPATETYWIELTGENFTGVPGTFNLNVSAWRAGYEAQSDNTITITIVSQTEEIFDVEYIPSTLNISYIESLFIQVTYEYNSSPIQSNTVVRVTFNGSAPVDLVFNATSERWETTLFGFNYLGAWDLLVRATADGYTTRNDTAVFTVHEDTPIITHSWPGNVNTTDFITFISLRVTVTDSSGTPINNANVSFTIFVTEDYSETIGVDGDYTFDIDPFDLRGVHSFTVYVTATGFVSTQFTLNLTIEATTSLNFRNYVSSEYEQWNVTIEASYINTGNSFPIENATVTVTIDGTDYIMQYLTGFYSVEIVLDLDPGEYIIYISATAEYAAYATNQAAFTVEAKEHVYLEVTFDGDLTAGQFMEIRATLRSNDTDGPISGQTIRFEVSVYFDNGTIIEYNGITMTDTTNTEGIATLGFEVPFGNIDKLLAQAIYDGSQSRWNVQKTAETGVQVSPISLLLAFFMSDVGFLTIISIALLGIVAAGYNRAIKPKKRAARKGLENQLQMFKDLETVQHFMAVYLDRGTCVFYHPFAEDRIQPDLISGFIAAITSVYGEIKGDGVRGTLEEIQYQGLRLNSYSGQYIIGILILGGEMTPLLRERLQFFVELFENQYDHDLDGWTGVVDCFDPEWVVSTLNSAFNYAWHLPHRFGPTQKVSKEDAKILDYIGAVRDDRNEFYIKDLLTPLAEMLDKTPAQVLDRLLYLQDRGVINPIGIQTILQRQGLALVDGADELPFPVKELEFELEAPPEEEVEPEPEAEPKEELEVDDLEAFVQDVESLLEKEADKEPSDEDNGQES